jgi:hypothetical protein
MRRIIWFLRVAGKIRVLVLCPIITQLLIASPVGAGEESPIRIDWTSKAFPVLVIQGDDFSRYPNGQPAAFRGFADPCLRRDPLTGDFWLAYSWPHMEHLGGDQRNFAVGVETHLAISKNGGKTWQHIQVLWPKTPARFSNPKAHKTREGFLSHEVPNIVPCQIDGKPSWVGARLDYFLGREGNYKDRDNLSFCIRLLTAPSPPELANAPYVTFGHDRSSPECAVDFNVCDFSKDFPSVFIPNEPSLFFKDGRLYFTFVCMTFSGRSPDFAKSFIAVLSTEPSGSIRSWKWRYHGKLVTNREAKELGGEALTQIEFALSRDGQLLAFLTTESWDPRGHKGKEEDAFFGIRHHKSLVVEVASLDAPVLKRRNDGKQAVRTIVYSSVNSDKDPGAAAYDPASETGILLTLRDISSKSNLVWTLHWTSLHP